MQNTIRRPAEAAGMFTVGGDLKVYRLGFGAMRLTLPIFSFQPTRFGHAGEDFAVAASSLRSEDGEHVLQVV